MVFCTVLVLMPIRAAMASLRRPRATLSRTSYSRGVREGNGRSSARMGGRGPHRSSTRGWTR